MNPAGTFSGFTKETVSFFRKLKKYNTRDWFEANREVYREHVLEPAKAFITAMGPGLKKYRGRSKGQQIYLPTQPGHPFHGR